MNDHPKSDFVGRRCLYCYFAFAREDDPFCSDECEEEFLEGVGAIKHSREVPLDDQS